MRGYEWVVHRRRGPVAFLVTSSMGLGSGEHLDARVELAPHASAVVTAQGPTSLLKTEHAPSYRWSFDLAPGAHVTYVPWVTIPFAGSSAVLDTTVRLASGSSFLAWETVTVGRVAMGERFLFGELRPRWHVATSDESLLDDRLLLYGAARRHGEAMLGGRTYLGSLYAGGWEEAELSVAAVRTALVGRLDLVGVSRPAARLLVVRALHRTAERIERAFWPIVAEARRVRHLGAVRPEDVGRRWFG